MTGPSAGILTLSNFVPSAQNTAPVIEFRCLYTSDLRRKQKRWQDGRLKFHTFNKRIMVYDDRSNFVGDSYWREDHNFAEGEEVELERCGVLVEVSECVGAKDQDLTPLLSRTLKDGQERVSVREVASSPPRTPGRDPRTQVVGLCLPKTKDLRSIKCSKSNSSPSSKSGYAQSLTGATLTLPGDPSTITALHYDQLWPQTLKQSIKRIGPSDSTGIRSVPQEGRIDQIISHNELGGVQAKRRSARLPSARVGSIHGRNITREAFIFDARRSTMRRLPSISVKKSTSRACESPTSPITMQQDEILDIDVYEREHSNAKAVFGSSVQVSRLLRAYRKKHSNPLTFPRTFRGEGQHDETFNSLRIKTRPRRKLFLTTKSPSCPPSFNPLGSVKIGETACPLMLQNGGREQQLSRATGKGVALINGNGPSSAVSRDTDHNLINDIFPRDFLGQTSATKHEEQYIGTQNMNLGSALLVERPKSLDKMEEPEVYMFDHNPSPKFHLERGFGNGSKKPSMLHDHIRSEIKIDETEPYEISRSLTPRLVNALGNGIGSSELYGFATTINAPEENIGALTPSNEADKDNIRNQDATTFDPIMKPTGPTSQEASATQRDDTYGKISDTFVQPMMASLGPAIAVSRVQMHCRDKLANGDQGPWSREAFDLFDWRPGPSTPIDSLI